MLANAGVDLEVAMSDHGVDYVEVDVSRCFKGPEPFAGRGKSCLINASVDCMGRVDGMKPASVTSGIVNCFQTMHNSPHRWTGPRCMERRSCKDSYVCVHGICNVEGNCLCEPGWSGQGCSIGECPKNCSGHGECDKKKAMCRCWSGWRGKACSLQLCPNDCNLNGDCENGQCVCFEGYEGISCDYFSCKNNCNVETGNGVCDQMKKRCNCAPWFTGQDCSIALCPDDCSGS
eukprot:766389-Hanusia_phi.AAC.8